MPCLQCGHCGKCGMYSGFKMELICSECGSSVAPGATECAQCGTSAKKAVQSNLEEIFGRKPFENTNE